MPIVLHPARGFRYRSTQVECGNVGRRGNDNDDSRGNLRLHRDRRRIGGLRRGRAAQRIGHAIACCCWKPAGATATRGSTSRSATPRPSPTRGSTGCSRASPKRSSTGAPFISRAARFWAAPARSTAWSICAAPRPITTAGASAAAKAGIGIRCCRSSRRPRTRSAGRTSFMGPADRCTSRTRCARRSAMRWCRPRSRPASRPTTISTARARRVSAITRRRPPTGGAGVRRGPISARRATGRT